jgi:hypothetical protein
MISSKLQLHFVRKKIRNWSIQDNARKAADINKKIKSVAILTTDEMYSQYDFLNAVEEYLGLKNTRIYCYRKFNKQDEKSERHFTKKDFNWKAEVIDPNFQDFLEHPFDLLISYFPKSQVMMEYTALKSKASFKVGLAGVYAELFDLEVTIPAMDMKGFFMEVQKYLKILNKI